MSSLRFATCVRVLCQAAHRERLVVPTFRSPPSTPGVERTIRMTPKGHPVIAVLVAGRPFAAICADLIEGVVAVNELDPTRAMSVRRTLWNALVAAGEIDDGVVLAAA